MSLFVGWTAPLTEVFRRRHVALSIDGESSRAIVQSSDGLVRIIRVRVQPLASGGSNITYRAWLQKIWRDGVLIEWISSPLQWAHTETFGPLRLSDEAWLNVCAVAQRDPGRVRICSEKGFHEFYIFNRPGRYTFEIAVEDEDRVHSPMLLTVAHNPADYDHLVITGWTPRRRGGNHLSKLFPW